MSTMVESAAQQRFQDTRDKLAVILNDLADVAEVRGEIWLNGEAAEGRRALKKQPLADVLRKKAETAAARTPFRVAVVGEFSRGKSTLINALLDREILVTDFRPNTAAITVLKYGEPERLLVSHKDELGRLTFTESPDLTNLAKYTSDTAVKAAYSDLLKDKKKSLAERIQEVEVWCISDFLKTREMEIIDTPGLGSVFPVHGKVTYKVIPSVDAALFLVQSDPGLGESEINFLKKVRAHVNQIFFVLTKSDMARSQHELEGMLEFVRTTVKTEIGLQVENLYPVSALSAIEGQVEKSGFPEFLPALQAFLVRSSGVAHLQVPQHLARTHWARLNNAVERDIQALDQGLNALRAQLNHLSREEKNIRDARDKLLGEVDRRIEELVDIATHGLEDHLPMLLQSKVETATDELSVKQLLKANDHLQIVLKDTVVGWLKKRADKFESSTEQLQHRIELNLREILDTIEASGAPVHYDGSVDVVLPQTPSGLWGDMGKLFGKAALAGGAGYVTGVGAAGIAAAILGLTIIPTGLVLLPAVVGLMGVAVPTLGFKDRAQKRVKEAMLKPMPGNSVNVYQAIVEGFEQDGQHIQGIRAAFEDELQSWGGQLKRGISETVTNNLDSRLGQLRRQIKEKEGGQQDREQELRKYSQQKEKLNGLERRLEEVADIIVELSVGQVEVGSRLVKGTEAEEERVQGRQKAAKRRAKKK